MAEFNLANVGNQFASATISTAILMPIGYGITRVFTSLNPVAGAVFFGSYNFTANFLAPMFFEENHSSMSKLIGCVIQITLSWQATIHLTPLVPPALSALSAKVLSTSSFVLGSITPAGTLQGVLMRKI